MRSTVDERCLPPIREALRILGGKWSFLVLAHLFTGTRRYNQLRKSLDDISTKSLTDTLRHLEQNGMVKRQVFPTVPVTVEYSLTEKGQEFQAVLTEMFSWGQKWGKSQGEKSFSGDITPV